MTAYYYNYPTCEDIAADRVSFRHYYETGFISYRLAVGLNCHYRMLSTKKWGSQKPLQLSCSKETSRSSPIVPRWEE